MVFTVKEIQDSWHQGWVNLGVHQLAALIIGDMEVADQLVNGVRPDQETQSRQVRIRDWILCNKQV